MAQSVEKPDRVQVTSNPTISQGQIVYKIKMLERCERDYKKLVKKNRKQYEIIMNKAEEIVINPQHYKNLRAPLQHLKEVHIDKHFVLTFSVNENSKTVTLEDFDHHTKIFKD